MQRSKRRKLDAKNAALKIQFMEAYMRRVAEEVYDEDPKRTSVDEAAVQRARENIAKKFVADWVEKYSVPEK